MLGALLGADASRAYSQMGVDRVLLMNDTKNINQGKGKVQYENYGFNQTLSLANKKKITGCWYFTMTNSVSLYNLQNYNGNEYWTLPDKQGIPVDRLWTLLYCRQGNTNPSAKTTTLPKLQNALPFDSVNSVNFKSTGTAVADQTTAGVIVMQNTPDAQIVSSCYSNGIGTVYFDAVNGFVGYRQSRLACEVAFALWKTNTLGQIANTNAEFLAKFRDGSAFRGHSWTNYLEWTERDGEIVPVAPEDGMGLDEIRTDYIHDPADVSIVTTTVTTNLFGRCAWLPAKLNGKYWDAKDSAHPTQLEEFSLPADKEEVLLEMPTTVSTGSSNNQGGGTFNHFYRVWANVEKDPGFERFCRGPMRFRIRRLDTPSQGGWLMDDDLDGTDSTMKSRQQYNALILVDNVIASYPAMRVSISAVGEYAKGLFRNQVGWAGSFSSMYPARGETGLTARAKVVPDGAGGEGLSEEDLKPANWVTEATMWWRWRYLDQKSNEWSKVTLKVNEDGTGLVSADELSMTNLVGDVEYWYEASLNSPYYGYLDYSGKNFGTPGYGERVDGCVSRFDTRELGKNGMPVRLPSLGTDYFTRLREGKSEQLAYFLRTIDPKGNARDTEFWLVKDGAWQTCLMTPTNAVGTYRFRVIGANPERCLSGDDVTALPWSGKALRPVEDPESATTGWTKIKVTGESGCLLFQLAEDAASPDLLTCTIVRAEYQDFNRWNDAARGLTDGLGLFVGSSSDGDGMSGVSPYMKTYAETFTNWSSSVVSGRYWGGENFSAVKLDTPGYESYVPFNSKVTPGDGWGSGGWEAGQSMWVAKKFRDVKNFGAALQMAGQGKGYLQYVNSKAVDPNAGALPRGIGELSFSARASQFIGFDDFCYRLIGEGYVNPFSLSNYTYFQPVWMSEADDFEGLGTVSVVACYRPGKGCYELRAERILDSITDSGAVRLSLVKWESDGKGVKESVVGCVTNKISKVTIKSRHLIKESGTSTKTYSANLFISVETNAASTKVYGGLGTADKFVGNSSVIQTADYSANYTVVGYEDKTKPFKSGSYGFLSRDCPARFFHGCHSLKPVTVADESKNKVTMTGYPNFFHYNTTAKSVTIHGGGANYGNDYQMVGTLKASDVAESLEWDWVIPEGRYSIREQVSTDLKIPGVIAAAPSQTIEVWTAPKGTTAFTKIGGMPLSGFTTETYRTNLLSLADVSIRIAPGGTEEDVRTDVTVSDVKVTQWRGDDFTDTNENPEFKVGVDEGCPDGFVFTSAVVERQAVTNEDESVYTNVFTTLQPMRVDQNGSPATIRSPLLDGRSGRGIGLGSIAFAYRNADTNNARLIVQICTNDLTLTRWQMRSKALEGWEDFKTIDFKGKPESGVETVYLGLHDVAGAVRLLLDTNVVVKAQSLATNPTRDPNYGRVEVSSITVRDEPKIDLRCWWGWNIRTTDESLRQYLFDHSEEPSENGLSLGLNYSVHQPEAELRKDVNEEEYKKHMPFVQSPTFSAGTIGEISFSARLYETNAAAMPVAATLTIYGSLDGGTSVLSGWEPLTNVTVTTDTFERHHYRAQVNDKYAAFRFAITGIEGVEPSERGPETPTGPVRVLLDEVVVSEAVYPRVGFSNVRPFRKNLEHLDYIEDILSVDEQPMCNESWSVQAEIEPTMLPDEIDMTKGFRVFLYWYEGTDAWGFDGWRKTAEAKGHVIELVEIPDRPRTFRGAYDRGAATIVTPEIRTAETVQYMLEVEYTLKNGEVTRDPLEQIDWRKPEWYGETDFNAGKKHFSAYTILDAVPFGGYAGINEVNIYGGLTTDGWYNNVDRGEQYVEVRVPAGADLTDWHLDFVTRGNSDDVLVTNSVAMFGRDAQLPPSKTRNANQNYAFIVAASPQSKDMKDPLEPTKSAVDGVWFVTNPTATLDASGEIAYDEPIAIRLVRPSGIIEHQVVAQGTNTWYEWTEKLGWEHSAERLRDELSEGGNQVFLAGQDMESTPVRSLGVFKGLGTNDVEWTAALRKTPGRINEGQVLDPDYPTPIGDTIIVYAQISGDHILQTFGDKVKTNELVMAVVRKGETTNITYHLDTWYETGEITLETNGVVYARGTSGRRPTYELSVGGAGISNNVTVTASARPWSDLATRYGLTEGNPYTPAALAWLNAKTCGKTPKAFANDDGEIRLAKLYNLSGQPYRPDDPYLSLTDMYWLDMDPTVGGLILQTGFSSSPTTKHVTRPLSGGTTMDCEDMIAKVKMRIYRENDDGSVDGSFEPYAPYTLNGLEPGSTSRTMTGRSWDAETFKITAHLNNGQDAEKDPDKVWMPVRYFHFDDNSFDENCEAEIQVVDPYYQFSDWYPWKLKGIPPPWYRFYLDARRFGAISSELLTPDSTFDE